MPKTAKTKLERLTRRLRAIKAKDIMTKEVLTTTENDHLAHVADIMIKMRISGLPVVGKKGKMVGMITATDLFILMDMIKSGEVVEDETVAVSNPTVKFAMSTEIIKIKKSTPCQRKTRGHCKELVPWHTAKQMIRADPIHDYSFFARERLKHLQVQKWLFSARAILHHPNHP